ncbi:hypothetical protein SAMN04489860_0617 [Paraoerskovia marina]|uniref:Uncharacterized protein n=1 Tax=Paraoerskovia marina TaxID=545619 RepID=A0A1H1NTG8_9CELL|nr:hypothetical protein [Paraoerskovia marina]SDS02281.1 hypothetical protein SAMN04489860_0617 [Paraoerskovia marina]
MIAWDAQDPAFGQGVGVSAAAAVLRGVGDDLGALAEAADGAEQIPETAWDGSAASAWRGVARLLRADAREMVTAFDDGQHALDRYADTLAALRPRVTAARALKDAALQRIGTLQYQPDHGSPAAAAQIQYALDTAHSNLHEADRRLEQVANERQTADDALVSALAIPGVWSDALRALERVGIHDVDALAPHVLAERMVVVARSITSGTGDDEDARALQAFLDHCGQNPQAAETFAAALGGAGAVALLARLGDGVRTHDAESSVRTRALAGSLRSALSLGTVRLSRKEATEFVDGVFTAAKAPGGRSVVAYLFGDSANAPMGREVTIAAAIRVDALERETGGSACGWLDDDPVHAGGGRLLAEGGNLEGDRLKDPAGRILQTLALYPDEALAWLTEPGRDDDASSSSIGEERRAYWFWARDWSAQTSGDGFEGPASLVAGVQYATGGPNSPPYDEKVWEDVAVTSSDALRGLTGDAQPGNDRLDPDHVTARGSIAMSAAVVSMYDELMETSILKTRTGDEPTDLVATDDGFYPGVALRDGVLIRSVMAATLTEPGAALVDARALLEMSATLDAARAGVVDTTYFDDRLVTAAALVDAGDDTARLERAARLDMEHEELAAARAAVLGGIPVPGAEVGSKVTGYLLDTAIGATQGHIANILTSADSSAHENARAEIYLAQAEGADAFVDWYREQVASLKQEGVVFHGSADAESVNTAYLNQRTRWKDVAET